MNLPDFSTAILVNQTPEEVFNALINVRGWWSEDIKGNTEKLNDEFIFRSGEFHVSTQKIVELIPNEKLLWLVTESKLNFIEDKKEWTGTKICFEISKQKEQTELRFTHLGLVPQIECYNACSNAWSQIIQKSLFSLITTGKEQKMF